MQRPKVATVKRNGVVINDKPAHQEPARKPEKVPPATSPTRPIAASDVHQVTWFVCFRFKKNVVPGRNRERAAS